VHQLLSEHSIVLNKIPEHHLKNWRRFSVEFKSSKLILLIMRNQNILFVTYREQGLVETRGPCDPPPNASGMKDPPNQFPNLDIDSDVIKICTDISSLLWFFWCITQYSAQKFCTHQQSVCCLDFSHNTTETTDWQPEDSTQKSTVEFLRNWSLYPDLLQSDWTTKSTINK
jgi:hypothetical protein